ncbi:class I SAM-dependent methyltransferase [Winogradskya consettensis]
MTGTLRASRTAVMVCQGRAAGHGLIATGRFSDPTAMALLRDGERTAVNRVRDGAVPGRWRERVDYEMVRGCAEMMVPRTVAIDDAVRERASPQVVILGAGLDGRAWRMPELAGAAVFEVDQPASQQDKRDRAALLDGAGPAYVAVDFGRDDLVEVLAAAGCRADVATTWIREGVVPYLTRPEVAATVAAAAACSAPGSRLIVNFQAPAPSMRVGQLVARALMASTGRRSVWAREPWRSTWTAGEMTALLARHGFTVTLDQDLLAVAAALETPSHRPRSLGNSRLMVADHN